MKTNTIKPVFLSLLVLSGLHSLVASPEITNQIDRHALVTRHNVTTTTFDASQPRDKWTPLQVEVVPGRI